jgi:hypothetical protein
MMGKSEEKNVLFVAKWFMRKAPERKDNGHD